MFHFVLAVSSRHALRYDNDNGYAERRASVNGTVNDSYGARRDAARGKTGDARA